MKVISKTSFVFGIKKVLASNKKAFVYVAPIKRGVKAMLLLLMFTVTVNAQSTTILSSHYDATAFSQLDTKNFTNHVSYKETNSQRVIVERKVTVKHPTKSIVICNFVKQVASYGEFAVEDNINDTLILSKYPQSKPIIVDGVDADIVVEYTIYVPKHIKHFQ